MRSTFCALLLLIPALAGAEPVLRASLGQIPAIAESNDKGVLVDFVKAMGRAYPEGKIELQVVPFKRSIENVVTGRADFHGPMLKDPAKTDKDLGFALSDENIWHVVFALYVHKDNKTINLENLAKHRVETTALPTFFDFPVLPSSCLDCSLKKVEEGRIDGFIFAAMETDGVVKALGLKNVRSRLFRKYEGKFVVPLGEKGKATNALLTKIIRRTRENGDYEKTIGTVNDYYKNWKPSE